MPSEPVPAADTERLLVSAYDLLRKVSPLIYGPSRARIERLCREIEVRGYADAVAAMNAALTDGEADRG